MIRGSLGKITAPHRGTETVVWNICSYKVTSMVGTRDYKI